MEHRNQQSKTKRRPEPGNGLTGASRVKVMACVAIAALALVAIAVAFPQKRDTQADRAKVIAAEALEFLRAGGNCESTVADFYDKYGQSPPVEIEMGAEKYTVTLFEAPSCDSAINVRTAAVAVAWAKGGKSHTVKMTGVLR